MSMMTFEVNILCTNNDSDADPKECMGIVTGIPVDRIEEAIQAAEDEARANDWSCLGGKWYCCECAKKAIP